MFHSETLRVTERLTPELSDDLRAIELEAQKEDRIGWKQDNAVGQMYERWFAKAAKEFYGIEMTPNVDYRLGDFVQGFEVKYDHKSAKTNNFFVEFQCSGNPSGIYYPNNMRYYIMHHKNFVYAFEKASLQVVHQTLPYPRVDGGDGNRASGILLPINKKSKIKGMPFASEYAIKIIELKHPEPNE